MRNFYFLFLSLFLIVGCSSNKITPYYTFDSESKRDIYLQAYDNSLKLWTVPYEETDVETEYGVAHVIISGPKSGKPLVLFHGTDASSTMWFSNINAFSKDYRVYAIDFPLEAGKSVPNRVKLSNKQTALFYNEIFKHFKMQDINLLGVSRGGWIATYIAMQPEIDINKVVLLSPAQTFGGIKSLGKVLTAINLKIFPSPKSTDRFFNAFSYHSDSINPVFKEQLYLAYKYGNSKPRLLNMTTFSKKELQSLKMPVLVLIGDHDIVNDEKIFKKAHQFIPNVETAVIKDAGHFLSIDQYEMVNKTVLEFLNKNE